MSDWKPGDPIFEHGGESDLEFALEAQNAEARDQSLDLVIGDCVYIVKDAIDDEDDDTAAFYAAEAFRLARELERRRLNG